MSFQTLNANYVAQRFALMAVDERREDALKFLCRIEYAIQSGLEAGIDKNYLHDTATGALDALANLMGGMLKDLDYQHLARDLLLPLDMSELQALAEKCK